MIDVLVALLFLLLMVVCAVAALRVKDLLAAVIIFGAFSFFSAAFFVVQDALDVAFTEAAVGAVITTVFFVCAIRRTTPRVRWIGRRQRGSYYEPLALLLLVPALVVLLQAAADLPPVGDGASAPFTHVAPYYIEQGHEQTGASNLVTAVLADYRGYDTLGELTVIFTAGVACLLVVSGKDGGSPRQGQGKGVRFGVGSPVIDAASRLLVPFMWLFATYVLVHGHESPGGGFQGGVILAASIILLRLVRGGERRSAFTSNHALTLACAGPLLYGGIGVASLLFGGNFLDYGALPLPLDPTEVRVIGTLGIETGVMVGVTGVLVLIFDTLASWDDGTV